MTPEEQQLEAGIAALEGQRALLGDPVVESALGPMRARLDALRAAKASPSSAQTLKQVSIVFMDVVGSTRMTQRLDPEDTSALMDGTLARAAAIVGEHRGKVLQYAGDSLLAAFGADQAAEDDAERAVRCGLALCRLGRTVRAELRDAPGTGDNESEERWKAIAATAVCKRWWSHMRELMPSNPDDSPTSRPLTEVFHL